MEKGEEVPRAKKTPLGTGIWHRYRYLVFGLLAANVATVSYAVLNQDKLFPSKEGTASKDDKDSDVKDATEEKAPSSDTPAKQLETEVTHSKKIDSKLPQEDVKVIDMKPEIVPVKEVKPEVKLEVKQEVKPVRHVSKSEQIELYKWILEEKRKIKPSSTEEKKRIDLEKSILKDYIRGKVPSF